MRCPDDEKFALYAEGNLNEEETSEFLAHLCECPECSALYAMACSHVDKPTGACPGEESIASLAEENICQSQRDALLKHMAVCKTCSVEFYLLRKLESAKTPAKRHAEPVMAKIYRLVAVAAMIVLVFRLTGAHNVFDRQNVYTPEVAVIAGNGVNAPRESPQPDSAQVPVLPQIPMLRGLVGRDSLQTREEAGIDYISSVPVSGISAPAPVGLNRIAALSSGEIDLRRITHINAQRLLNSEERVDWQQAYDMYVQLAESYSGDYLAAFGAGEAARKLGDNDSARTWHDRALAINPNYQPAIDARAILD